MKHIKYSASKCKRISVTPNPSFEPTAHGKPWFAAKVKR